MDDKQLFEQLARDPLPRNGFDEALRRKINESLKQHGRKQKRVWYANWRVVSAAMFFVVLLAGGLWSLNAMKSNQAELLEPHTEQATGSSTPAAESGVNPIPHSAVVIGLRQDLDALRSEYRTILVAPQNEELAIIAKGQGVWMPYKQHFWQVDAVPDANGKGLQTIEAVRSGVKKEVDAEVSAARLSRTEKLLFAGNSYVSLLETTLSNESGQSVNESRVWINLVSDLDPAVRARDLNALQNNHYSIADALDTGETSSSDAQWAIAREQGRWVIKEPPSPVIVPSELNPVHWPTSSVQLSEKAIGPDTLAISWEEVTSLEPGAIDAYTSGNEEVVIIVTDESIKLYPYRAKKEEMREVDIPLQANESIVMVQWATQSNYVDNWIKMFSNWFPNSAE